MNDSSQYSIVLRNCNSIAEAYISLGSSSLNIKYGPNGIGKSTLVRALQIHASGEGTLDELRPFKYRGVEDAPDPSVEGAEEIRSVLVFNDQYVSRFAFQADEVLRDSFEIFINTREYRDGLNRIETLLEQLKTTISEQQGLEEAIAHLIVLRDAFVMTKGGAISKVSRGIKAFNAGGKLANIPEALQGYQDFLLGESPADWLSWQAKGKKFQEASERCPFCTADNIDKTLIATVSETYETAGLRSMADLGTAIEGSADYFEPSALAGLRGITRKLGGPSEQELAFVAGLRKQVELLLSKLTSLRTLSFHSMQDVLNETQGDFLRNRKIDLELLPALASDRTRAIVDPINLELEDVAQRINVVKQYIGQQKATVARLIRENESGINDFLATAGFRYRVAIEAKETEYRMILRHEDATGHIVNATSHLSYGERNAFAMVLFMYDVRSKGPDLVILDDPVSSFDRTKKFAILHQLFHGRESIRGFTTMLLTHDLEPAIDVVVNGTSGQFSASKPVVDFLKTSNGILSERRIVRDDIMTFSEICRVNIQESCDDLIKCVYLRRLYEVMGQRGLEYEMLSSLLHCRINPTCKDQHGTQRELSSDEMLLASVEIGKHIPEFDYNCIVQQARDKVKLIASYWATSVGYEKLQIFRVLSEASEIGTATSSAFRKFVNESFHIENEYIMQLDPREFDVVPEYIVSQCDEIVAELS